MRKRNKQQNAQMKKKTYLDFERSEVKFCVFAMAWNLMPSITKSSCSSY
jgi:hypothetical protein